MASIKRISSGDKTRYRARWRTPDGESRSETFDRRVDAERRIEHVQHSKSTGAYVDPGAGRVTFKEYAEKWRLDQLQHRPSTAEHVEQVLRKHLYPAFGNRPLGSITPSAVQAFVTSLSAKLAPATVKINHSYLVSVFKAAVRDRIVAVSPCVGINLPQVVRPQVNPLTPRQVERMQKALPERYRALVYFIAYSGLRSSEAFALTTDRIDFKYRTVRVDRQLARDNDEIRFAPVKTKTKPVRELSLPQQVIDVLVDHLARFAPAKDSEAGRLGLVFTDDKSKPISHRRFYGSRSKPGIWHRARVAAGLSEDVTLHDLRHYHASLLIRQGLNVKDIQERLGHSTPTETLETYSHLWPDSNERTRKALEDAIAQMAVDEPLVIKTSEAAPLPV
jgi:integrase